MQRAVFWHRGLALSARPNDGYEARFSETLRLRHRVSVNPMAARGFVARSWGARG